MPKLDVLVVGATGQLGGVVARALLQGGHHVRALTRNLAHPAADVLRLRGARLAWAGIDDTARMEDVAAGADAIFAVTTPAAGPAAETRHGMALIELAGRLDIPHLVYSSSMQASAITGAEHSDSKHEVEQYLRASAVPYTIVCPGYFMENLLERDCVERLRRGELALPLRDDERLQQIARPDAGRFMRVVLERRSDFLGQRVCIASDELTPIEMAATLARVLGHSVTCVTTCTASDAPCPGAGACADVVGLRSRFPEVNWHTLDGWAKRQDWTTGDSG
ncbi:MAG: NmrA/HSCARG family protein [Gemmatimonadota bacterium]